MRGSGADTSPRTRRRRRRPRRHAGRLMRRRWRAKRCEEQNTDARRQPGVVGQLTKAERRGDGHARDRFFCQAAAGRCGDHDAALRRVRGDVTEEAPAPVHWRIADPPPSLAYVARVRAWSVGTAASRAARSFCRLQARHGWRQADGFNKDAHVVGRSRVRRRPAESRGRRDANESRAKRGTSLTEARVRPSPPGPNPTRLPQMLLFDLSDHALALFRDDLLLLEILRAERERVCPGKRARGGCVCETRANLPPLLARRVPP